MISRDTISVTVRTYSTTLDEYGQQRKGTYTDRTIKGAVYLYGQSNENTVQFVNVDKILLTKDANITTDNQIIINTEVFNVRYVIQNKRYWQIMLQKV